MGAQMTQTGRQLDSSKEMDTVASRLFRSRFRAALVLASLFSLLLSACTVSPTASSSSSGGTIVIGGVGPLSQPGQVQDGQQQKWAMELAVADINANGG